MTTFIDTPAFPLEVGAWAMGGRGKLMTRVMTGGGDEFVNTQWAYGLGEWDIAEALRSTIERNSYSLKLLRKFLVATGYGLYGFRFRDPSDCTDEGGGVIKQIGATSNGQLYKRYTAGSLTFDQIIQKPFSDVVVSGGTLNFNTGVVTGSSSGTWTGHYDVPVRFADAFPHIGLDSTGAYWNWQQIKLKEWKNWAG